MGRWIRNICIKTNILNKNYCFTLYKTKTGNISLYNYTWGIETCDYDVFLSENSPKIALIFIDNNHYNAITQDNKEIESLIDQFKETVTSVPGNEKIFNEKWIGKGYKPPGKNKEAPKKYKKIEGN